VPRWRFGQDDVLFEFRGVGCGLATTQELSDSEVPSWRPNARLPQFR
jgi:hypothetical protein